MSGTEKFNVVNQQHICIYCTYSGSFTFHFHFYVNLILYFLYLFSYYSSAHCIHIITQVPFSSCCKPEFLLEINKVVIYLYPSLFSYCIRCIIRIGYCQYGSATILVQWPLEVVQPELFPTGRLRPETRFIMNLSIVHF